LGAVRELAALGERVGGAEYRREGVVGAADRVEVVLHAIAGLGLDDHPRPVVGERAAHVAGGGDGIAHVVQAVEAGDQVIARAGESVGAGDLEAQPVR
jgi:hypothetical protein